MATEVNKGKLMDIAKCICRYILSQVYLSLMSIFILHIQKRNKYFKGLKIERERTIKGFFWEKILFIEA